MYSKELKYHINVLSTIINFKSTWINFFSQKISFLFSFNKMSLHPQNFTLTIILFESLNLPDLLVYKF